MKRIVSPAVLVVLLASMLFLTGYGCAKKEVRVKANKEVVNLVKSWDKVVVFYTSRKAPLLTIEGLGQKEIACSGPDLAVQIKVFYDAAGTQRVYGNAVQVIAPQVLDFGMENAPRLYVTWKSSASLIKKEAVRVVFTE